MVSWFHIRVSHAHPARSPRRPVCVACGRHNPVPQPGVRRQFWRLGVRDHRAGGAKEGSKEGPVPTFGGCGNSGGLLACRRITLTSALVCPWPYLCVCLCPNVPFS